MSLIEGFDKIGLVKVAPSLRERLERRVARTHHESVVTRLRRLREQLEREMAPEPWTELDAPALTVLADVCAALGFTTEERFEVLGLDGDRALHTLLASRPQPRFLSPMAERQAAAMGYMRQHGRITLGEYRRLCPHWSSETLRLDLVNLVKRGVVAKNGRNKGTSYILVRRASLVGDASICQLGASGLESGGEDG